MTTATEATPTETETPEVTIEQLQAQLAEKDALLSASNESITKLTNKNDELLGEKQTAKQKAIEAEQLANQKALQAAKESGDIQALIAENEKTITEMQAGFDAQMKIKDNIINDKSVVATANSIATDIAKDGDSAWVLSRFITDRLRSEIVDGAVNTYVVDESGQRSAMSIDALKEEFKNNPRFAHNILGTGASGQGNSQPATVSANKTYDDYTEAERQSIKTNDPQAYVKLLTTTTDKQVLSLRNKL